MTVVDPANRLGPGLRAGSRSPRAASATETPTTVSPTRTTQRTLPRRVVIGCQCDPLEVHRLVTGLTAIELRPPRLAPLVRRVAPHREEDRDEECDEDDGGKKLLDSHGLLRALWALWAQWAKAVQRP